MQAFKYIIPIVAALLLSGCATMPASKPADNQTLSWQQRQVQLNNIQDWIVKGAAGVKMPKQGGSAQVVWQQQKQNYTMNLFGPLGMGAVEIVGNSQQVTLKKSATEIYHAKSPEQLIYQQVGWTLPVSNLYYWVRGLPVPKVAAQQQFDNFGHLSQLQQMGWQVTFLRYTAVQGVDLPSKIILTQKGIKIKLIINQWKLNDQVNTASAG